MIVLSNIKKSDKNGVILNGVSLKYSKSNNLNILIAKNCSAKASLMNIFFGFDREFEGVYRFDRKNSKKMNATDWDEIRYSKMQVVFQNEGLLENISVIDNLYYASDCKNMLRFKKISDDLMMFFEIEFLRDELVNEITGLEKKFVGIARALMNSPELLILDEPTANLNEKEQKRMIEFIERLSNQGQRLLVVTNDSHIYHLGDSIYKLSSRSKKVKKVKFKCKETAYV